MTFTIGLLGNPNSGKTTLFNQLTGSKQKIANWPGVTVEKKSGFFKNGATTIEVVDLPGTYSLVSASESSSIDEKIACEFILSKEAHLIINIVDASHLERHLYLTTQLIEMKVPFILAVNMMDIARNQRIHIDLKKLSEELGCPVVALEANRAKGVKELKQQILKHSVLHFSPKTITYAPLLDTTLQKLMDLELSAPTSYDKKWLAIRLLEGDAFITKLTSLSPASIHSYQQEIVSGLQEDADILFADARYRFIENIIKNCVEKNSTRIKTWTTRIDHIVLNRLLGLPIFFGVMYSLFLFAINIGGAFQDFFDIGSETIFVNGFAALLTSMHMPNWLVAFLANGIGKGINTTVTFIPVIGAMFLALAFLEDSGYMARAAFVVDRFMRMLGLPGKAFIPMIVGFGCNVPSVMAARTLENRSDRILTVMMSPFMSCGARLAIYAVFVAAFFPKGAHTIVFALYCIGILMAVLTGFLLRKTLLKGDPAPLVLELPPYHFPQLKLLMAHAWQRLKGFVYRAGKLIIPICLLLGALNTLNIDGSLNNGEGDFHSILSMIGQWLTPLFSPMGISQDNWPATLGLLTGVLAKEVVVGTLNSLYSQLGHLTFQADTFSFFGGLHDAFSSIVTNLSQIKNSFSNPIVAHAPINELNQSVYGIMYERFDGKVGAIAYLLFVLLYFPCVSTVAVMIRELNRWWAFFSVAWTTLVAYGIAVCFYQLATFFKHPATTALWVLGVMSVFLFIILRMRKFAMNDQRGGVYEFARR